MNKSRYEKFNEDAFRNLLDAMKEEHYVQENEYIIVIRNVTDGYNVDFTRTDDGVWADEVFEISCDIMNDCAYMHKAAKYITIIGKCYQYDSIELIKARERIINNEVGK